MKFLPIFLNVEQQACLIVGGGAVAARRAASLLAAGAQVTVIAPELHPGLAELYQQGKLHWQDRTFKADDVTQQQLIVAATDDPTVNAAVQAAARLARIPVNLADEGETGDFIFPAVLDRSPILIALSSGGQAPVLTRQLKARLETLIPEGYRKLAQLMGRYRQHVKQQFATVTQRRRFWDAVSQGEVAEHVLAGRDTAAETLMEQLLSAPDYQASTQGEVYLVGAGPGDPDLLTFKALRLMQQADVVFYDRLVSQDILKLVRKGADLIYVGKQRAWHSKRQEEINQLLVDQALQGKRVLRLKGGDPFIFGRGGEEIATLAEHQIPFQVIPGITAASGCACYAGIPLTHRDYAQSCVFVTGQMKNGRLDLNWSTLVQPKQTIVVYMGLAGLDELSQQLQRHGMPADMPAALIQQGTTHNQRVWASTIAALPEIARQHEPIAPTLLIIGEVVQLHEQLAWLST